MKPRILLLGRDIARLAEISAVLDPTAYSLVVVLDEKPLAYLRSAGLADAAGVVAEFTGLENVVDLHEALLGAPRAPFVFLIDQMPPSAAMARVAGDQAVFLAGDESALTIAATLVALTAQRKLQATRA